MCIKAICNLESEMNTHFQMKYEIMCYLVPAIRAKKCFVIISFCDYYIVGAQ